MQFDAHSSLHFSSQVYFLSSVYFPSKDKSCTGVILLLVEHDLLKCSRDNVQRDKG